LTQSTVVGHMVTRDVHGTGWSGFSPFLLRPRTIAGCENCTREPHKKGRICAVRGDAGQGVRVMRGEAGSIPRSRNTRNQSQIFSITKQIIEK